MPKITFRGVQIALGFLWLLDGVLQLQHQMFTSAFATQVITAAATGQPTFVSGPMHFAIRIFLTHPAIFNSLFALTQMAIGGLILWKRSIKFGLIFSILWGFVVWIFGEGYGGIFSGHTLLLMGAPGAVLLYMLLALAVMPSKEDKPKKRKIAYWIVFVWVLLWIGGGIYQLLPGQNSTSDVSAMIAGNADGAPGWLSTVDTKTANFINNIGRPNAKTESPTQIASEMNMSSAQMQHMTNEPYSQSTSNPGYVFIIFAAALQMCIGIGALLPRIWRKTAIGLGIILAIAFWIVGESLGGYYTGLATDPNSGPLIILLGLTILGCSDLDIKLRRLVKQTEAVLIGKPFN